MNALKSDLKSNHNHAETLSLEGFEALLDQVFAVGPTAPPVVPVESTADGDTLSVKTSSFIEIISASDKVVDSANTERAVKLLEAQLNFMRGELQRYGYLTRFLQGQISLKDDQLRLIPDLMARSAQINMTEKKLSLVQNHCRELQQEIEGLRNELHQAKAPWWQKLQCWLTGSPLAGYSA